MELTNIHPAEAYLRNEQNPSFLYIRIYGERRKLFLCGDIRTKEC